MSRVLRFLGIHRLLLRLAWLPSLAFAREPGLHLSWVRTPDAAVCADRTQVEADVERRLGWAPFALGDGPRASIEALVTRSDGAWQASLVMRRADGTELGTREVTSESPSCDSLAKASGLALALMIENARSDLMGAGLSSPIDEPTPPRAAAASVPAKVVASAPAASTLAALVRDEPVRPVVPGESTDDEVADAAVGAVDGAPEGFAWRPGFGFAAGVVCAAGVLPGFACGPALNTTIHLHPRFAAGVTVRMLPEQSIARSGARVGFDWTSAALSGCYALLEGGIGSVSTCASLLVGMLHITVEAPAAVGAGQRSWWATSLGVHGAWQLGVMEVRAGADVLARLARHDYAVQRVDPAVTASLFEEAPVGFMGSLGVGVRF